jgi:pyruvate/2-oxoglutarate dehydrogenase complex dihydrolipoamide dehydrogenase (E3) component
MRRIRAEIGHEDSAERYSKEFGVEVFFGDARFASQGAVDVNGARLQYSKAVIATGARAIAPPIPGLADAGHLDNESVFNLTERPERLGIIGAGPIGCELAQTFRRLGSNVTVFERKDRILTREDPDAARIVQDAFQRDGINIVFGCTLEKVERKGNEKVIYLRCHDRENRRVFVDEILVGAGRAPNVEGMGLEEVGVEYDMRNGVKVDDYLRTTNQRIYAVGDVCMNWKFTHAADAAAKIAVQNALFFGRKKLSRLVMPWCTYTDPEIAHVGLYARDAEEQGIAIDTYQVPIAKADRAVTDGQTEGMVKVQVKKGTDHILGATIVASHAGELITQFTLAISQGIGLGAFTKVIYPYPTQGEALKVVAGAYMRRRLTPWLKRRFTTFLRWRR